MSFKMPQLQIFRFSGLGNKEEAFSLNIKSDYDVSPCLPSKERLMHFPTWVDLKGEDAVPETVHHVVVTVDPRADTTWSTLRRHIPTDGVHQKDNVRPGNNTPGMCVREGKEMVCLLGGSLCILK